MLNPYHNSNLTDTDMELADEPVCIAWQFWGYGIMLPIFLVSYGIYCIMTQSAWFPFEDGWFGKHYQYIYLEGRSAICMGIATLSGGLFLTSHIVMSQFHKTHFAGVLLSYVSLIICLMSMAGIIVHFFFEMFR